MSSSQNRPLAFIHIALELAVIAGAVYGGYLLSRTIDIIPDALVRLPDVYVSSGDAVRITRIFLFGHALFFGLSLLLHKTPALESVKRFADEYIFYLLGYTAASLFLFLATDINYDPQMIAAIGLLASAGLLILITVNSIVAGPGGGQAFKTFIAAPLAVLRRLLSVTGVLTLAFFFTPLLLGKAFVSDRDVANVVTQVRIFFAGTGGGGWGLNNALNGVIFAQPMLAKLNPKDPGELVVLERNGIIKRVDYPSGKNVAVVIDINERVGEVEVENGALGFAFHPAFGQADHPHRDALYFYYTDYREGRQTNRLSRFDLSGTTAAERSASETPILTLHRENSGFHNGGSVEFGPDGYLYIGLGEGIHPPEYRRYSEVLRSGVLRIDVDSRAPIAPSELKKRQRRRLHGAGGQPVCGRRQYPERILGPGAPQPVPLLFRPGKR